MKYAVIEIQGKQYPVKEGEELTVAKMEGEKGKKLTLEKVLLVVNEKKRQIGTPLVKSAKVTATLLEQVKGKKIRVATYKAKSRYRRVKGHRDQLTKIKINKITV
jgi:large subunit ribosomal protein L21